MAGGGRAGAVPEVPFWLELNGRRLGSWTCSPGDLAALVVGRLLADGYLEPGEPPPVVEIVEGEDSAGARVRLVEERVARVAAEQDHRTRHGCGIAHLARCMPDRPARRSPGELPRNADFPTLFRELYAAAARYQETGGLHAAALSDGRTLRRVVEEVGRHNAVDRVIGHAVLDGNDLSGLGLVLTARVSGEIALKAARAGLGWIASRSVPTTLALEIAGAAGIPILARAVGKEPRLFPPGGEPRAFAREPAP